jgi:L-amino acid N-acyltransferase YncA
LRQQTARHEQIYYAIRPTAVGKACGQTSFLDIQPEQGVIEIGSIWFGLTLRRTRSATESMYLMLRYAMDDLGYRRMQWRCNALNATSRAAARRLGFRFEGIFHNHMIFKGRNRDTAWYSILDDEWPVIREIMERWLAPSNFDQTALPKPRWPHSWKNAVPAVGRDVGEHWDCLNQCSPRARTHKCGIGRMSALGRTGHAGMAGMT